VQQQQQQQQAVAAGGGGGAGSWLRSAWRSAFPGAPRPGTEVAPAGGGLELTAMPGAETRVALQKEQPAAAATARRGRCWERWRVRLRVHVARDPVTTQALLRHAHEQLRACLLRIAVEAQAAGCPPLTAAGSFPWDVGLSAVPSLASS
jgi:hypothetical protein